LSVAAQGASSSWHRHPQMFRNPPQTAPPRDRRKGTDSSNSKGATGGGAGEPHALVLSCSEFTSVTPHNSIIQKWTSRQTA